MQGAVVVVQKKKVSEKMNMNITPCTSSPGPCTLKFPISRLWAVVFVGIFALFSGGCGQVNPGEGGGIGVLDHDVFKASIQPIMDNRTCADSGCHIRSKSNPNSGGPGGSLRLFDCDEGLPCTDEQLQSNHDSAAGMANLVNPGDSKLLTKPLGLAGGGLQHLGGTVFPDRTDADYLTILSWIGSPL